MRLVDFTAQAPIGRASNRHVSTSSQAPPCVWAWIGKIPPPRLGAVENR